MSFQINNRVPKPISITQYYNRPKIVFNYFTPRVEHLYNYSLMPIKVNQVQMLQKNTYSYPNFSTIFPYPPLTRRSTAINPQSSKNVSKSPTSKTKRLKIFDRNYSINNLHHKNHQKKSDNNNENNKMTKYFLTESSMVMKKRRKIFSQSLESKARKMNKIKSKESDKIQKKSPAKLKSKFSPYFNIQDQFKIKAIQPIKIQQNTKIPKVQFLLFQDQAKINQDQLKIFSKSANSERQTFNNSQVVINIQNQFNSDNFMQQPSATSIKTNFKTAQFQTAHNLLASSRMTFLSVDFKEGYHDYVTETNVKANVINNQLISHFSYLLPVAIIFLGFIILLIQMLK